MRVKHVYVVVAKKKTIFLTAGPHLLVRLPPPAGDVEDEGVRQLQGQLHGGRLRQVRVARFGKLRLRLQEDGPAAIEKYRKTLCMQALDFKHTWAR